MGGKSHRSGQYGEESTSKALHYDPENLKLVTDKTHPLYDERVHLPVDERLVLNIMANGVIQPITVRHNGLTDDGKVLVEVVAGRQRVKCCIEANKRLVKEGKEPHRVPAILKRAEQGAFMGIMISENEIRKEDSPLIRARKLARYLDTGHSEAEAAIMFGVTLPTVKNLLKVLELHPTVQKAIDDGLPTNVAKELSVIPQEEQPAALEKLVESGNVKGARGVEAAKNVRRGKGAETTKVRMLARPSIEQWKTRLKKTEGKDAEIAYAVLSRLLGNTRALGEYPRLRGALEPDEAK